MRRRKLRRTVKISARVTVEIRDGSPANEKADCAATQSSDLVAKSGTRCRDCPYASCRVAKQIAASVGQEVLDSPKKLENLLTSSAESKEGFSEFDSSGPTRKGTEVDVRVGEEKQENLTRETCPECRTMKQTGSTIYTMDHVSKHCTSSSCWLVAHGIVYDATDFLDLHPAGSKSILRRGGKDATRDFDFHSKSACKQWRKYQIGKMKGGCAAECTIS